MAGIGHDADHALPIVRIFRRAVNADSLTDRGYSRPETFRYGCTHNRGIVRRTHFFFAKEAPLEQADSHGLERVPAGHVALRPQLGRAFAAVDKSAVVFPAEWQCIDRPGALDSG